MENNDLSKRSFAVVIILLIMLGAATIYIGISGPSAPKSRTNIIRKADLTLTNIEIMVTGNMILVCLSSNDVAKLKEFYGATNFVITSQLDFFNK